MLSPLNIYGAAIASVLSFALASGLNLIALKNEFHFELKAKKISYIFFGSFIMLGTALGFLYLFKFIVPLIYSVFLSLIISAFVYLFLIIIMPIFENDELNNVTFGNKITVFRNKFSQNLKKFNVYFSFFC